MLADLRYGCRSLLPSPGFAAANMLTLGLGTGATIAVLTLLDAVLLRPLPLEDPDRTVTLERHFEDGLSRGFVYPELERIREESEELFEVVAGSGVRSARVISPAGARLVSVGFVTERFFDVVGARPVLGRGFAMSEHLLGADPVVVLPDAFWRSQLGADPSVLGARVRTGDRDATVVGALPRGFRGLDPTRPADLFLPLRAAPLVLPPANYLADCNEQRQVGAAIRVALGVSRFRLLRLFLTETFLLAGSGSFAGLLVSVWLLQVVGRFVLPGGVSIGALDFEWSGSLVACGLVAAVATALLCGLLAEE